MIRLSGFSVAAVFGCVPARTTDNFTVTAALAGEEKAKAIVQATGFPVRRSVEKGQTVLDLMLPAAQAALTGVNPYDLGGIVAVSFSSPERFPSLAVRLQHELGLPRTAATLDLGLACSGYPYGLMVAGQLAAATGRPVLLVDGDVQSAHVDVEDVNTLAVMSDAATATLVMPGGGETQMDFLSDGSQADVLRCSAVGPIHMNGFGVFRFVATEVTAFLKEFLAATGGEVPDFFVPHQANMYMVRQLAVALGLDQRLLSSGPRFANPGSCSVPLTLAAGGFPDDANGVHDFDVLLAAFGAGLSASAARLSLSSGMRRGIVEI